MLLLVTNALENAPGPIAKLAMSVVAVGFMASIAGAGIFLLVMAAHNKVLGRPTPPPKP
jgi:hypothetical protein